MYLVIVINKEGVLSSVEFSTEIAAVSFAKELGAMPGKQFPYVVVKQK